MSGALDCRDLFDRQEMLDQAQFESGDDPVANLGAIIDDRDHELHRHHRPRRFGLRQLARRRGHRTAAHAPGTCPALALLGIGNGAQVALAYAGSHPNKVARLVLDSPLPLGIAAEAADRAAGQG